MKALLRTEYGTADVLHLAEVPKPTPAPDEVLIRVHAASVNGSDKEGLSGRPAYARIGGLRKPRYPILGSDVAGVIESVGSSVSEFRLGDSVFGGLPEYRGGFAEYACAPASLIIHKPPELTYEEAAAIPQAGVIAYRGVVGKGEAKRGQRVLINGAGGGAGTFAVQLAKLSGAHVTAVDCGDKLDLLRSLGADDVIDYKLEDFTTNGERYDLILDVIASRPASACARALAPGGTYFYVGGAVRVLIHILIAGWLIRRLHRKKVCLLNVPPNRKDLISITELCKAREVVPVVDRLFPFDEAQDALRYVLEARQHGKVVITFPASVSI